MSTRTEKDTIGTIEVPNDKYWGAQTQRAIGNFKIGEIRFRRPFLKAFGIAKTAAAQANMQLGTLDKEKGDWIVKSAAEVIEGKHDDQFPLVIFHSGSGTQMNMNVNEVIANRAIEMTGGKMGTKSPIHPNDHVNQSQSTNCMFPTVMHIASVCEVKETLLPSLGRLKKACETGSEKFKGVVKLGRTHLQDAVPLTLGQEYSGWASQLEHAEQQITEAFNRLQELAIGGTAVGTGLNSHPDYSKTACEYITKLTGHSFVSAPNKFEALAAHDTFAHASASLRSLAGGLMKIANDVRWLGSGPRCGLGELILPANEPGSSIMPGKVNPTQAEALTQVVVQVYGNDAAIAFAASQGNFELNVYKPVLIHNMLESIELLSAGMDSFREHCLEGIEPNSEKIEHFLKNSLMLVTALNPYIGYEKAAQIANKAYEDGTTLKEAALALQYVTSEEFDQWVDPHTLTGPKA
ncbi:MAG: fumarate hydratase, class II [Bdellovibrionaceae bacterium]|nr:fumarate hydratase, class II [Pseudobdellovibrionaceae bacterium]|tara:strand:+ start:5431 stop:6822 length:1392 start_codon:yes stop_codon:yes gene_type:complete